MFEASVNTFVKTVGRESLHPVPNLDEASSCKPLQVVVKRSKYWPWQKPKYETTPFSLHQLLQNDDGSLNDKISQNVRKLTTYNKTHNFSVSGKIGGKLKKIVDLELNGSETFAVSTKFGEITKKEIDQPKLVEELVNLKLDMNHEFVSQVQKDARKVLCVVVGTAELAADGSVSTSVKISGEESVGIVSDDEDANLSNSNSHTIEIPSGTPIAFNVRELLVHGDGEMEMIMESGLKGGFLSDTTDGELLDDDDGERIAKESLIEDSYLDLINQPIEVRSQLEQAVLELCNHGADIDNLLDILSSADSGDGIDVLPVFYNEHPIRAILEIAQIAIDDKNQLTYPEMAPLILECLHSLIAALSELDDQQIAALSHCNKEQAGPLMKVIYNLYSHQKVKVNKSLSADSGLSGDLLTALNIVEEDGVYNSEDANESEIESAYRILYALWGHQKSEAHSCILI